MAKELNAIIVQEFKRRLGEVRGCVLVNYQGLDSEKTASLRSALREGGVRMTVLRNRLAAQSLADRRDVPAAFRSLLVGPTAILYGEDGALSASKCLSRWQKQNKGLAPVKGGLLEGRVLDEPQVAELAKIPDKETLQANAAGLFLSPLSVLASAAQGLLANFAGCAKARQESLASGTPAEGEAAAAGAAATEAGAAS